MQPNYSDVIAFKKPFMGNTSARVTINPQSDIEPHNNLPYVIPLSTKQKSFSIISHKNFQSFSTSALPCYNVSEYANNCEISNSIQNKNIYPLSKDQIKNSESLGKKTKNQQISQQKLKLKKQSLPNQIHSINAGTIHSKSNTQINLKNMRQTTSPNCAPFIPKHKQPQWIQKMEMYTKNVGNAKTNHSYRPYENNKEPYLKLDQNQVIPQQNQFHKQLPENKIFFRQTLDPQIQKNLLDSKEIRFHVFSPNHFKKKVQKEHKQFSATKMDKMNRTQQKNHTQTNASSQRPNFWKSKLHSPQHATPKSPQKFAPESHLSKDLSIPLLPLHSSQKPHRPSFFPHNKKSLSRFNIMKQLGTGTYNDAYLCSDRKTNSLYCLKKYHKATIKNLEYVLEAFIKKIGFQMLADDPNVVQLYDIFSEGDYVYTVQEFMEGGRLLDCLQREIQTRESKRRETLNFVQEESKQSNQIIDRAYDIASALKYIHQTPDPKPQANPCSKPKLPPMVHGDIRIKSILISMGVCKVPSIEPANTKLSYINQYSPPELIVEKIFIPKSDIWNLGLVLYELCSEKKLFSNKDIGEQTERMSTSKKQNQMFNVDIEKAVDALCCTLLLKDLIKKMLAIHPQNRPNATQILSSNVFKMYGLDVQWKQRRNQKLLKEKDIKQINFKGNPIKSGQQLKTQQQLTADEKSGIETPPQKQKDHTLAVPNKNRGSPVTNLSFSRDSNSNYTYEQAQIQVVSLVKPHWISKNKSDAIHKQKSVTENQKIHKKIEK